MQKYGIMIMSGFAALWFVWGLSALPSFNAAWLGVPVVVSGAMIVLAARMPVVASEARRRSTGRIVGWASGIEGVAIFVAQNVLNWTGHAPFMVVATLAIVGLHFLPLAHFLRVPRYYVAGAAMIGLAAFGLVIPGDATRVLVLGVGAALLLWATCLSIFDRAPTGVVTA